MPASSQSKAEKALPELKAGVERRKAAERKVESHYAHATKTLQEMMSGLVRAWQAPNQLATGRMAQPAGWRAVTSRGPSNAAPDTAALFCSAGGEPPGGGNAMSTTKHDT